MMMSTSLLTHTAPPTHTNPHAHIFKLFHSHRSLPTYSNSSHYHSYTAHCSQHTTRALRPCRVCSLPIPATWSASLLHCSAAGSPTLGVSIAHHTNTLAPVARLKADSVYFIGGCSMPTNARIDLTSSELILERDDDIFKLRFISHTLFSECLGISSNKCKIVLMEHFYNATLSACLPNQGS